MLKRILRAPVRLSLFCALLGVALGALTIGPLDSLVALPAAVAACAVVLAAALAGRGLSGRVARGEAENEAAEDDRNNVAERLGVVRDGED